MGTVLLNPYRFGLATVTAAHFLTGSSNVDQASYTTASGTPVAGRLYLLFVVSVTTAPAVPPIPTVTGQGQTWTQVTTAINVANTRRITVFRALGGSPSAGTLTIDFGAEAQIGCGWSAVVCTGMSTGGSNGSGAIIQTKAVEAAAATGASVTLDAPLSTTGSAVVGAFTHQASEISTATAPATKLGDTNHSAPARGTATAWALNPPGPSLAMTWATSAASGIIAVEVGA